MGFAEIGVVFGFVFLLLSISILPTLLLGLALPYGVLRLRSAPSADPPDPQVGLKAALYFFFSLGILLILNGLTVIAIDLVTGDDNVQQNFPWAQPANQFGAPAQQDEDFPNAAHRTGGAMIASGLLFVVIHWFYLVVATNNRRYPSAKRMFVGWRTAIHGVVVLLTITALLLIEFQEEVPDTMGDVVNSLVAILLVWAPSWFMHLALLRGYSSQPYYSAPKRRSYRDEDD